MIWGVIYGMILAVVLMLTWGSNNHVIQKLGFLMAASWALSNVSIAWLGFSGAPIIVPSINAVVAVIVGGLGFRNRNWTCLAVFGLYGLEAVIAVGGYATHRNGEYSYYAALNAVFMLRMFVVGGSAISDLACRLPREYPRPGYRHLGG